ncbi:MAG TPA: response regulator [Caulobacteraceae bacterium]|nr:response regulator [Caulobacteraceae bacterium]
MAFTVMDEGKERRVLVVEDEAMIALLIEDMLSDLGCAVIGPAYGLDEGLELARRAGPVDAALLDVNLAGQPVYAIADELRAKGVPMIFSTGYGDAGLREVDRGVPVVRKPFRAEELAKALELAWSGG